MTESAESLAGLERRVAALEERADIDHGFLLGIDRSLTAVRERQVIDHGLIEALHVNQQDHTRRLNTIEETLREHTATLAGHTATLAELGGGMRTIVGMLNTLIERDS